MTTSIDLSGQDDVYNESYLSDDRILDPGRSEISVKLDGCPTALPRVYGLLSIFQLVPEITHTRRCGTDRIVVTMAFDGVDAKSIDLLRRKLLQLTETIDVAYPTTSSP